MKRSELPVRNAAIVSAWIGGESTVSLADRYSMTTSRVLQIIGPHTTRAERAKRNADAVKANWQDPEFRKRQADATKANWQDPEFRKRNADAVKRACGRRIVKEAGLPLTRSNVDRALDLLAAEHDWEIVIDAMRQERRAA